MKRDKVVKDVIEPVEEVKVPTILPKEEVEIPVVLPKEEVIETKPLISPKWIQLKNEILGKDFGLDASAPDSSSGFRIRVIVPKDKSNASESHWGFYKHDIRTKAINNSDGPDGVENFFKKVARNLGITPINVNK